MSQQGIPTVEDMGDGTHLMGAQGDLRVHALKADMLSIVFAGPDGVEYLIVDGAQPLPGDYILKFFFELKNPLPRRMSQSFRWIWKDINRRERLCAIYNEIFNSIRPREYDGQHIRFEGMNPEIALRPHQVGAIAHVLYGGNTLLAHEVGAGKTFEMVAAAMEMKRLGLCTKSLVVVPNHITEQWAAEWLQLYPSANILVATKKDFETQNRKKFCSRIATGDYDAIIIGHSQFEKIPTSFERHVYDTCACKPLHECV